MASVAYKVFLTNMDTVNRLLIAYDDLQKLYYPDHKRGRQALDHITRSTLVFLTGSLEVYVEDSLKQIVNIHIKYAHSFFKLPQAVQAMLHNEQNSYNTEKWIQKYRRITRTSSEALNTPKLYKIQELFHYYADVNPFLISNIPKANDIDAIITRRGEIAHAVKSAYYITKDEALKKRDAVCEFVKNMDDMLANYIKTVYPNERLPWNKIG
jgi:hypothetical protein